MTALAAGRPVPAIIPLPEKIESRGGTFVLGLKTAIVVDSASRDTGEYLARRLRQSTGYPFPVRGGVASGGIVLTTQAARSDLGPEGYELAVTRGSIVIRASEQAGIFYGVQTLLQLLPPEVFASQTITNVDWEVSCVRIEDQPRFRWRGFMLDVSRHFFSKDEVKQLLDAMALHKLNTFHWHLVDNNGWRIEIKRYPKLTSVGAWRSDIGFNLDPKASTAYGPDGRYGGFYTQDDIREVVAYAQKLHITIVPEIEMPGHSVAALAAHPEFSCAGGGYTTDTDPRVHRGVYCAGRAETFEFLQNVLTEVFALFPSRYIHIGGDEVNKANWRQCELDQALMKKEGLKNEEELQSYFIRRTAKFVNAHGKTPIGWSEILQGGLAQNAVVMDWMGGGREAAIDGHDVVMTPGPYCYLTHYQSRNRSAEPRAHGGYLPLPKVYSFEPIPANLPPQYTSHILGAQGSLWTEYIPSLAYIQFMVFPRLSALAETVWSPKSARNWYDFSRRLQIHYQRLDQLGFNYRHYPYNTQAADPAK